MSTRDETLILPTGRRIGYRCYGADTTPRLLYLHGRPGSRVEVGVYDEDLLVERGLCVIAMDRPGYGLTDPLDTLDPLSRAQDAADLLAHLDLAGMTVQGFSGGAIPALATGVVAQERVRAVIVTSGGLLNDPNGTLEGYPPDYREGLLRERDDKPAARRDAEDFAAALREDPVGAWRDATAHWPEAERAALAANEELLIEDSAQAIAHGGLGYFLDNMASWQPWPTEFDALDLPVHVFQGEGDQWALIALARKAFAGLRDVRWTTYDGDHFSPFVTRDRQAAMLDLAC